MNPFDSLRSKWRSSKKSDIEKRAAYIFQLRENNGEIWLTFADSLVCPATMLKDDVVKAVSEMRRMYIERNTN